MNGQHDELQNDLQALESAGLIQSTLEDDVLRYSPVSRSAAKAHRQNEEMRLNNEEAIRSRESGGSGNQEFQNLAMEHDPLDMDGGSVNSERQKSKEST